MAKFQIDISEYGNEVRSYSDTDMDRFLTEARKLIENHLTTRPYQQTKEIKNIQIHVYTVE